MCVFLFFVYEKQNNMFLSKFLEPEHCCESKVFLDVSEVSDRTNSNFSQTSSGQGVRWVLAGTNCLGSSREKSLSRWESPEWKCAWIWEWKQPSTAAMNPRPVRSCVDADPSLGLMPAWRPLLFYYLFFLLHIAVDHAFVCRITHLRLAGTWSLWRSRATLRYQNYWTKFHF